MKELTAEELDRWAAEELLGWTFKDNNYMVPEEKLGHWRVLVFKPDWHPSSPASPAWQLLAVIDAMRKKGFYINHVSGLTHHTVFFLRYKKTSISPSMGHFERAGDTKRDVSFLVAILRAAHAAYQEEGK